LSYSINQNVFEQRDVELLTLVIAQQLVLLPLYFFVPAWILGVNSVALLTLWLFRGKNSPKLLKSIKLLLVIVSIVAIFVTYQTISGRTAGVALIAVMYGLKILEIKQKKQATTFLSLSFFILAMGFLFTQKPWIMFYQVIPVVAILNALVNLNSLEKMPSGLKSYQSFLHVLKTFSIYLLFALPVMMLLFLFFPRLDSPLWRMPGMKQGISGVSETMSPGEIGDLQQSDEIAFRVKFDKNTPDTSDMYWRVLTLDRFDGFTWSRGNFPLLNKTSLSSSSADEKVNVVSYTLSLEPTKLNYLVSLERFLEVSKSGKIFEDYVIKIDRKITDRLRYSGRSIPGVSIKEKLSDSEREHHLKLPDTGNARLRQWAKTRRHLVNTNQAFIQLLLKEINQKEYFYTLQPPIMDEDTQDSFWLDHKKGFCEHYASALVFMARAVGIPARVVVGYQGGDKNPLSDYWIVRHSNAHAWTEVWFESKGWVRVDPTSAIASHRIEESLLNDYAYRDSLFDDFDFVQIESPDLIRKMSYWVDGFNHRWNNWVINYNRQQQLKNLSDWGLSGFKLSNIMIAIIVALLFLVILAAYVRVNRREKKTLLAEAFLLLEQKLERSHFVLVEKNKGPEHLKGQLIEKHADKLDKVIGLIDKYIELTYRSKRPDKSQVEDFVKQVKQLSLPVNQK
jgi:transglutaminase-like putative cysteine protease